MAAAKGAWLRRWLVAAAVAAAVGAFLPTLWAGWVWDDVIFQGVQLPHFRGVADAFRAPEGVPELTGAYVRPLVLLTYLAERSLGDGPALAHGTNLLLHALATLLVYRLGRRILAGRGAEGEWGAVLGAWVFAVHPIHAESVCNVAGRSDLLAAVFVLAALLAGLRALEGGAAGWTAGFGAALGFGLLSKEIAVAALPLLPILAWAVPRAPGAPGRRWGLGTVAALVLAAYAGFRLWAGAGLGGGEPWPGGWARLAPALAFYLRQSVFPWPAVLFAVDLPGRAATALTLALGTAAGALWVAARPDDRRLLGGLGAWFALTLAPSLVVAVQRVAATPVAERYLYLPSVALCLLLGAGAAALAKRGGWRLPTTAASLFLVAAFAGASLGRTWAWRSDLAFWAQVVQDPAAAETAYAWTNLGYAHLAAGEASAAISAFERAARPGRRLLSSQDGARALHGLGTVYYVAAETLYSRRLFAEVVEAVDRALPFYENSVATLPGYPLGEKALGKALLLGERARKEAGWPPTPGRAQRARDLLAEAVRLHPRDPSLRQDLEEAADLARRAGR